MKFNKVITILLVVALLLSGVLPLLPISYVKADTQETTAKLAEKLTNAIKTLDYRLISGVYGLPVADRPRGNG